MNVIAIISVWMLINTWAMLMWAEKDGTWFSGSELWWLLLYSVIGVPMLIALKLIVKIHIHIKFIGKCKKCVYYCEDNNTCQSKKCATSQAGYVSIIDKLFCKPKNKSR